MQEVVYQIQKETNVLLYVKCMYIYTVLKHDGKHSKYV